MIFFRGERTSNERFKRGKRENITKVQEGFFLKNLVRVKKSEDLLYY